MVEEIRTEGVKLSALIEILQGHLNERGDLNMVAWITESGSEFTCPLEDNCPINGFFYNEKDD